MHNYFYVVITLEYEVKKTDLDLGYQDDNGSIREYALEQVMSMFPSSLFDYKESHDAYIFSLKGDLEAKPFLLLRDSVLAALDVNNDSLDCLLSEMLHKILENSSVTEMIKLSQYGFGNPIRLYERFRWREYPGWLSIRVNKEYSLKENLEVATRGIQIYLSRDLYTTEASGVFPLVTNPLKKLLKPMKYYNFVSVMIGDIEDRY